METARAHLFHGTVEDVGDLRSPSINWMQATGWYREPNAVLLLGVGFQKRRRTVQNYAIGWFDDRI